MSREQTDLRGGQRVTVEGRAARVVRCERRHDKAARRGGRVYLVRFEDDKAERRFPRAQISPR